LLQAVIRVTSTKIEKNRFMVFHFNFISKMELALEWLRCKFIFNFCKFRIV
jgi:hypothetical protein